MNEEHGYGSADDRDEQGRAILWRGDAGTIYQRGEGVMMGLNGEAVGTVAFEDFVRAAFGDEAREAIREDLEIARLARANAERELQDA